MNTKEKLKREFDEISMNIDSLTNEPQSDDQKELTNKRDAMRTYQTRKSGFAWIAIIIAIAALALAWAAYNRSGTNLGQQVENQYEQAINTLNVRMTRFEAAADLAALEAEQEIEQNTAELAQGIAETREDLQQAYAAAEREASQEWVQLNQQLEQVEQNARSGSANALASLEQVIANLRQEVRTDEQN